MTSNVSETAGTTAPTGRILVASGMGNLAEWYDFLLYAYMAPVLASLFFPAGDETAGLLSTFAIFGVGFLVRPLTSPLWGILGDRIGRTRTLAYTVLIMGAATTLIAFLPTYNTVGIWAPFLLLVLRVVQGFAATGEWIGSLSFLLEQVSTHRRGLFATLNTATTTIPPVLVALVVLSTQASMSEESFMSWGWRLPFLLGGVLSLIGLYIRLRINETLPFLSVKRSGRVARTPVRSCFRQYPRQMCAIFVATSLMGLVTYTLAAYFPSHLVQTVGLSSTAALAANAVALLLNTLMLPGFGLISDRIGRKPMMVGGAALVLILSVPAYYVAGMGGFVGALLGQFLLVVGVAVIASGVAPFIVEIFSTRIRYTGGVISQTMGYTLFAGTAPLVSGSIVAGTDSSIAPGVYVSAVALVSIPLLIWLVPETYRWPLLRDDDLPDHTAQAASAEATVRDS